MRRVDKTVINSSKTNAIIYFTDNTIINLNSDIGKVEDLVAIIYSPLNEVDSWESMVTSLEDTVNVKLLKE